MTTLTDEPKTEEAVAKWRAACEAFADAICSELLPEDKNKGAEMRRAMERAHERMARAGDGADRLAGLKATHPVAFAMSQTVDLISVTSTAAERAEAQRRADAARTGVKVADLVPRPPPPSARAAIEEFRANRLKV